VGSKYRKRWIERVIKSGQLLKHKIKKAFECDPRLYDLSEFNEPFVREILGFHSRYIEEEFTCGNFGLPNALQAACATRSTSGSFPLKRTCAKS
jgi:hypothetical protein